jgi:hypothetical protein
MAVGSIIVGFRCCQLFGFSIWILKYDNFQNNLNLYSWLLRYAPRFHGKNPEKIPKKISNIISKKKSKKKIKKKFPKNQKTFMPKLLRM